MNQLFFSDDWVRLEDGLNDYQGRVQIQYIGLTGVFCDSFFDVSDAAVVCRHFGFREGLEIPILSMNY